MCVGQAMGCLAADGKLMGEHDKDIPSNWDKTKIAGAIAECSKMVDADPCETAYKQWTCLLSKVMKAG